jgi:Tol biopolymer transport system component
MRRGCLLEQLPFAADAWATLLPAAVEWSLGRIWNQCPAAEPLITVRCSDVQQTAEQSKMVSRSRRQFVLGLLAGMVTAACSEASPAATPAPASPAPGSPSPVPTAAGQPVATSVQIVAAPSPLAAASPSPSPLPVQAGLPLIVPGRVAAPVSSPGAVVSPSSSPSASPGASPPAVRPSPNLTASPVASPAPLPIVLGRPGLLAVVSAGRVLLVDPARQQPTRVLVASPDSSEPVWSPDGSSVLYVGGLGSAAELRLASVPAPPSGSSGNSVTSAQRLTANARPERGAAWSPRGDRLAYTLPGPLGPDGLPDPAAPEEVWLLDIATGADRKLADGFDPCWSPDGRWLAYATNGQRDQRGARENAIRVIFTDGQDDRPLLAVSDLPADLQPAFNLPFRPAAVRLRAPAWSPTGQHLVASADGHTSIAWTFDVRGQSLSPWAAAYEGGVGRARWSPDGQRLAVESLPVTGVAVLVLVDLASRRETAIGGPDVGFQASGPAWAADGSKLALIAASLPARRGEPRRTTLRLAGTDGTDQGELVTEPDLHDPDWGRVP